MSIYQLNFEGKNKIETAIGRIKMYEPPEGYYLAFSGGKDSITLYDLATKSGVKFDTHYSQTGIDPPELVKFIRKNYPNVIFEPHTESMFSLITRNGLPTRRARFCCKHLKEQGGIGRFLLTGIRWAESPRRRMRNLTEVSGCYQKTKKFLHPIIDWSDEEVWEYIKEKQLRYCELYNNGFKRLGCILCPMATEKQRKFQSEQYPKFTQAYKNAIGRLLARGRDCDKRWNGDVEKMFNWWIKNESAGKYDFQETMFTD